jgi:hypothetical protein
MGADDAVAVAVAGAVESRLRVVGWKGDAIAVAVAVAVGGLLRVEPALRGRYGGLR